MNKTRTCHAGHALFLRGFFIVWLGLFLSGCGGGGGGGSTSPSTVLNLGSLWVTDNGALHKVLPSTGQVGVSVTTNQNISTSLLDARRAQVWVLGKSGLVAYDLNGQLRHQDVALQPGANDVLALNSATGEVWLAHGTILKRYSPQAIALGGFSVSANVVSLDVDAARSVLWVASQTTLAGYDSNGAQQQTISLPVNASIRAIDFDPKSDLLWVVLSDQVLRMDANGMGQSSIPFTAGQHIQADGAGGVWVSSSSLVVHISSLGNIDHSSDISKLGYPQPIRAISVNPQDQSLWVATGTNLLHLDKTAQVLKKFDLAISLAQNPIAELHFFLDNFIPTLQIAAPTNGISTNQAQVSVDIHYQDDGMGVDTSSLILKLDGQILNPACNYGIGRAQCSLPSTLVDGVYSLQVSIQDKAGNQSAAVSSSFTVDTKPPQITLTISANNLITNQATQSITGLLDENATLVANGTTVSLDTAFNFNQTITLQEGVNTITLQATDTAQNSSTRNLTLTLDTQAPGPVDLTKVTIGDLVNGSSTITGQVGSVEAYANVTITNLRIGIIQTVKADSAGAFTSQIAAITRDSLSFVASDSAGNRAATVTAMTGIPRDPAEIAPALDKTVTTSVYEATKFLYQGTSLVQTGLSASTVDPRRVAVLRGKITDRNNNPLVGVTVTILNHSEFGSTLSRNDGMFDLVVNGGGSLVVQYQLQGYLPVQRKLTTPWKDYIWVSDVVMIPLDSQVTTVNLSSNQLMQVVRGKPVNDNDGARQATILFPQGTQATMVLANGSTQTLTNLSVRATEYTVGSNGPQTMPASLPPTSGYTYAVELSVDEATAAGATQVNFSQPVPMYTENFLNFPVGTDVPVGYYDRKKAIWMPSSSGRVVRILSITNGVAELDVDGSGQAASQQVLAGMNITLAERTQLAQLYTQGQSLWRSPVPHFSTWDMNWGISPPKDADVWFLNLFLGLFGLPSIQCGSVIECQKQVLGESIPVTGTPFTLNYRTERTPGFKASYSVNIPLTPSTIPNSLKRVELEVLIAGQRYTKSFPAQTDLRHIFTWNGKDAYGRYLQGAQRGTIRVGYVYDSVYQWTTRFGYNGNGLLITSSKGREELTLWRVDQVNLGPWDAREQGLGGWSLNEHHVYHASRQKLYMGDGSERSSEIITRIIDTVAGGKSSSIGGLGDGGLATAAYLPDPKDVAIDRQGNLYISTDTQGNSIRKVSSDGVINTVAGNGVAGFSGDGGTATAAQLSSPKGIAVDAQGNLYIADSANNRIRMVTTDGIIRSIAGSGSTTNCDFNTSIGDDGPATQARLCLPTDVVVDNEGNIYIADSLNYRIRKVDPNGIITTIAGNGQRGVSNDDLLATTVSLDSINGIALDNEGNLYIADGGNSGRVRKVGTDGIISTVAGGVACSDSQKDALDGKPATQARLCFPKRLEVDVLGNLYITEGSQDRVRMVNKSGTISTIAGASTAVNCGFPKDKGPAVAANLCLPAGLATDPSGNLYIADSNNNRLRKVTNPLDVFTSGNQVAITSEDGTELYQFDSKGRHLSTINAINGNVLYTFTYNSGGYLTRIQDGDGNITTINRNGNIPISIVSHDGQITHLQLDANGYLASVTNPANESVQLSYDSNGLLLSYSDPKNNQSTHSYDGLGRLLADTNAAQGGWSVGRTIGSNFFQVNMQTGLNHTVNYRIDQIANEIQKRTNTYPDGTSESELFYRDGRHSGTRADGTTFSLTQAADPRFGMQAPYDSKIVVTMPGGLVKNITRSMSVNLQDPSNLLSLVSSQDTNSINGRTYTSTYDVETNTITLTSPQGRQGHIIVDTKGRPIQILPSKHAITDFSYDSRGRLSNVRMTDQGNVRQKSYSYDASGFLQTVTDPLQRQVRYEYDAIGRVTKVTLPDTRSIQYSYDANGNLTSLITPSGAVHNYQYNNLNQTAAYLPPSLGNGNMSTTYSYNKDQQLTRIMRPGNMAIDYGYDNSGRLDTITVPGGQRKYSWGNSTGNLKQITAEDGGTLSYLFDGFLLRSEAWSGSVSGNVTRSYDNNFWLTSLAVNGNTINYSYDNDGLLTQAGSLVLSNDAQAALLNTTALGGVHTSYSYNGFGEVKTYNVRFNVNSIYDVQYTRDALGRILTRIETMLGATTNYEYGYDNSDRLITVKKNGTTVSTYTYDNNGNRLSHNTITGSYNAQDQLVSYGGAVYTYTPAGDLSTKTEAGLTTGYTYDAFGNLTGVVLPNNTHIQYIIDGNNRRIGRKINGTLVQGFLYKDNLKPVAELDGNNNLVSLFVYGTRSNVPDYMVKGGITYRFVVDHVGSPRLLINTSDGSITQRIDYDEYGNVINDTNPGFQPFGYAGGLYDNLTGLVHFGARDYDPHIGRWTSKDPIQFAGGDVNLYGYVLNDPINLIDPNGLAACRTWGGVFKGLVKSVAVGALMYATGGAAFYLVRGALAVAAERLAFAVPKVAKGVSNPVPGTVARVVPDNPITRASGTLGRPGADDVFVTAADDIRGLNAKQIAERLTIPESPTGFRVIEFPTPKSGIASPVNRTDTGFIGGGRTAGGAREFVIPNGAIPAGSSTRVVP